MENQLEKLAGLEESVFENRKQIGDPDALVARVKSLQTALETLKEVSRQVWYPRDDGYQLVEVLEGFKTELDDLDQSDLKNHIDKLEEIEAGLQTAVKTIVAAADRLRSSSLVTR